MPSDNEGSALGALIGLGIALLGAVVVASIIDDATKKRKWICPDCGAELRQGVVKCPNCGIRLRWA